MVSEHASPLAALGGVDAGGQNVHVAALAEALGRRGIEVVVYTRRESDDVPARVPFGRRCVVEHVDAGPPTPISKDLLLPYMGAFAARLGAAWRRWRPDVVHAHFWMSGRAALAAAGPLGIPVVETFHALGVVKRRQQAEKDTSPPERLAEEQAIIARAAGIVATCRDEVAELRALGADLRRIRVVPCGVDLALFRPEGAIVPRETRRRRLVSVGRLVERKGIGNVISALARLPDDVELVIAGGPDPRQLWNDADVRRLAVHARREGVDDRVRFLGRVERADVAPLLRSADVAVCVPWYERFGIVPLEAMACGVPVLASAVGGLLDTVVDGVTGLHVPPRDPDAIAAALRQLLDDAPLRARLGAAGAVRAHCGYGWDHLARATLSAYRAILSGAGTRGRTRRVYLAPAVLDDGKEIATHAER
jgi:glycosyltransferase involved in cell wall biosynthesis